MKQIVFLGSKFLGLECLKHILDQRETLNTEVVAVLFNPKASYAKEIKDLATANSIPVLENPDDLLSLKKNVELMVSVQYHLILQEKHILSAKRVVNLHTAPLPEYRGCNQFTFAILERSKIFGTTIHEIKDRGVDTGSIIAEKRFEIPDDIFVGDLHAMTVAKSISLFKETFEVLVSGEYTAIPQSDYKDRSTSTHKRSEIEGVKKIDLSWPKEKIERYIRATTMPGFSGPYIIIGDKKIYLNI